MLSPLRNRFGIPGVISVIALVFAMLGGAYAASNDSDSGKATASAKAKQGPRGKPGKPGPAGPAGPAGPQGPAGAAGAKGDKGDTGNAGSAGAAGKSVTTNPLLPGEGPVGEECEEGGVEIISASGTDVICDGEVGPPGADGADGTDGAQGLPGPTCPAGQCVLPVGSTLTGVWNFSAINVAKARISISYPLRIPGGLTFHYVKYEEQGTVNAPPQCPSSFPSEPEAASGHLCVYEAEAPSEQSLTNASVPVITFGETDYSSGVPLSFTLTVPANEARGGGSWAATR
ncbi:MAG: hypothetical protein ABW196_00625 [Solirubrobacterales bacterium]